jgi:hypothetical protein
MCLEQWSLLVNAVMTVTAIVLAAWAIWGNHLNSRFGGPRLTLLPKNLAGPPTPLTSPGTRTVVGHAVFYHLQVANRRHRPAARNCRVLLEGFPLRNINGEFIPLPMPVPLQFTWTPAESSLPTQTIADRQILDFGFWEQTTSIFRPTLYSYSNNFAGFPQPGQTMRYRLRIYAENFVDSGEHVIEVAWPAPPGGGAAQSVEPTISVVE